MYIYKQKHHDIMSWIYTDTGFKDIKNYYIKLEDGSWKPVYSYAWVPGAWGACSASCGGGTQYRTVTCHRYPTDIIVNDKFCSDIVKPTTSQVCNTQTCVTHIQIHMGRRNPCPSLRYYLGTFSYPIRIVTGDCWVCDMCGRPVRITLVGISNGAEVIRVDVKSGNFGVCDDYDREYLGSIDCTLNITVPDTEIYFEIDYPGKNNCCDEVGIPNINMIML